MKTENNNDILLIEDYIDGKLSKEKTQEFEKRVENDPEFRELYHFRLKIKKDLQNASQYNATQNEVTKAIHQARAKRRRNVIYAVAASITLLIAITGVLTLNFGGKQQQMAETEIDSMEIKTHQPQIKHPKSYANSGEYSRDEIIRRDKITSDSVTVSWEPGITAETEFNIT